MNTQAGILTFGMHMVDNCLIVPLRRDMDDEYLMALQQELVRRIKQIGTKAVVIDVSAVNILDTYSFNVLRDAARMAAMLGARCVFVGFQPGVASALVDLEVDLENIETAIDLDEGLAQLRTLQGIVDEAPAVEENSETPEPDREEN